MPYDRAGIGGLSGACMAGDVADGEMRRRLAGRFQSFAEDEAPGSSPLYLHLSRHIARDPEIAGLLSRAPRREQHANLFFAAVHFLLLSGLDHPLAGFYPSLTDRPAAADGAWETFRAFCQEHRDRLTGLISTRGTQTNEVCRSAYLLPAFTVAAQRARGRPLALLEVGASAGLNLNLDRYRYGYSTGQTTGPAGATVHIRCEVRGSVAPPVPATMPNIAWRAGIDRNPLSVRDPDQALWLRACVWPEHRERAERLERAIEVARLHPPEIVKGNAVDLLAHTAERAPPDALLCIYQSNAAPYMSAEEHARLESQVLDLAAQRDLCWIASEGYIRRWSFSELPSLVLDLPAERLWPDMACALVAFEQGRRTTRLLALADLHARWLEWRGPASSG